MGKLYLLSGDYILNSKKMDAIVNSTNKYMEHGDGICGVIYDAAGPKLADYCLAKFDTKMKTGEVRITPGFDLNIDIIHVLSPKYNEEENPIEALTKTYKNLLDEIAKKKYKNVLLPSLGTGIFGYTHEEVAKPVVSLLNNFCKINKVNLYLNNMYPEYKDYYLKEYMHLNLLDLKKDLNNLSPEEMYKYLKENNLLENDIEYKYNEFVKGKDRDQLCKTEKLIYLQYKIVKKIEENRTEVN